jgi:hypothetical protein
VEHLERMMRKHGLNIKWSEGLSLKIDSYVWVAADFQRVRAGPAECISASLSGDLSQRADKTW